jgi:hypothetical protein
MTGKPRNLSARFDQPAGAGTFRPTGPEGTPEALRILREQGVQAYQRYLAEQGAKRVQGRSLPDDPDAEEFEPGFTGPDTDPDRDWLPGEAEAWAADQDAEDRAADRTGVKLKAYWTRGPGLAKWRGSPTPWRTLRRFLSKYLSGDKLDRTTSAWYIAVFGKPPGRRRG